MREAIEISDEAISAPNQGAAVMLILAVFALGQAIHVNNGSWHPMAMGWLTISILILILGLRSIASKTSFSAPRISPTRFIGILLAVQWVQLLLWGIGSRRSYSEPIWIFVLAMFMAGAGTIWLFISAALTNALSPLAVSQIGPLGVPDSRNRKRNISLFPAFTLLLVAHFIAGAYVIRGMTPPHIDVWNFQQDSTAALMHGQNPYTVRYRNIYGPGVDLGPGTVVDGWTTFSFPYPPLTLLLDIPGRLIGDVRWSNLLALEFAAILISLTWPDRAGPLAAALLLLNPSSLFVIYSGWTEPNVIFSFALMLYCARRKPAFLWVGLGLFLVSKQYAVFVAPLVLLAIPQPIRLRSAMAIFLKAVALATAITLPFVLWNPAAFVHSVVILHLHSPLRMDGLAFSAMMARLTGLQIPSWLGLLAIGMVSLWAWRNFPRTQFAWNGATALALLLFFAFTKQAFCNYYFLVIGILCSAVAMTSPQGIAISERVEFDLPQPKRLAA
jgi:hypothetical protein